MLLKKHAANCSKLETVCRLVASVTGSIVYDAAISLGIVPVEKQQRERADDQKEENPDAEHGVVLHSFSDLIVAVLDVLGRTDDGLTQLVDVSVLLQDVVGEYLLQPRDLHHPTFDLTDFVDHAV